MMKLENLKTADAKLYAEVVAKTKKYKDAVVLHQKSDHHTDAAGNLIVESTKTYDKHQRVDRVVLSADYLKALDKSTPQGDVIKFRAALDKVATFNLLCTGFAVRNNLASHAREHSHCFRRVARTLGRADLYKFMLFGKRQKKLAPITLAKISKPDAKAKTAKLIKARSKKVQVAVA